MNFVHTMRTVVLATATLGSSWSAYQGALWSGVQAREYTRGSALRAESLRASSMAIQLAQIDVTTFAIWAQAVGAENRQAAAFLRERFRPEFVPAFEAWLAKGDKARRDFPPGTPFRQTEYHSAEMQKASRLLEQAETAVAEGQRANNISDNFLFAVVLFSMVIFLTGIEIQVTVRRPLRLVLAAIPFSLLVFALAFMLRLPSTAG